MLFFILTLSSILALYTALCVWDILTYAQLNSK